MFHKLALMRLCPWALLTTVLFASCQSSSLPLTREFLVQTEPAGATLLIDGEVKGQTRGVRLGGTNEAGLPPITVVFKDRWDYRTLLVEMPGYAPAGLVLTPRSPAAAVFVLEKDETQQILEGLEGLGEEVRGVRDAVNRK